MSITPYEKPISPEEQKGIQLVESLVKDLRSNWIQCNLKDGEIVCDVILQAIHDKFFKAMLEGVLEKPNGI